MIEKSILKRISPVKWEIPKTFRASMRVPARIFATEKMLAEIIQDKSLEQLVNVATLPGIQEAAIAMPDIHEGYGFPIGGVAATTCPDGVISPGGIGYDINCGVRLLVSSLKNDEVKPQLEKLAIALFQAIPSGVGRGGKIKLADRELNAVLKEGVGWAIKQGYGEPEDARNLESEGRLEPADPETVSNHAKGRGRDQLGTLGAGNHFVEVGAVEEVLDDEIAGKFGLAKDQVTVLVHSGSRGLGHQVATDYIRTMLGSLAKYNISLPDRELACAPLSSPEGKSYFAAMSAAANFAWVNRQLITAEVREVWQKIFGANQKLSILYDVAHNIAKLEEHIIDDKSQKLIVHRKGATRAFPDQPVIIPGSMGTASYVLVGTKQAMTESFGSTCHGAGRRMSRGEAKRQVRGDELRSKLHEKGIIIQTGSLRGLAEEAPFAYKDIHNVVDVVETAGIARKVARLRPLVVIKG